MAFGFKILWAGSVFVGLELALIAIALISALETTHNDNAPQWSVAGLVNSLARRVGFPDVFNLDHLPRKRGGGVGLLLFLFVVALVFNLADTLRDVDMLSSYSPIIHLVAKISAGLLGPVLELVAGHNFAADVVRASQRRHTLENAEILASEAKNQAWAAFWDAESPELIEVTARSMYPKVFGVSVAGASEVLEFPKVPTLSSNGHH